MRMPERIYKERLSQEFQADVAKGVGRGYHAVDHEAKTASYGLRATAAELGIPPERLETLVKDLEARKIAMEHGVDIAYRAPTKTVEIERRDVKGGEVEEGKYHEAVHAAFNAFVELARKHK